MIDACRVKAHEEPRVKETHAEMNALLKEIAEEIHSRREVNALANQLYEAGYGFMLEMAEAMFVAG